jgi:hypothetical protein
VKKKIENSYKKEVSWEPSQRFVDWDSPPTYDEDVNEEDSIEEPLTSDLKEKYEEDGFFSHVWRPLP